MYAQHFKGAIYNQKMIVAVTAFLMTAAISLCAHQRGEYLGHQRICFTYSVTHIVFYPRPES